MCGTECGNGCVTEKMCGNECVIVKEYVKECKCVGPSVVMGV